MIAIQFKVSHSFYVSLEHNSYEEIQRIMSPISGVFLDEKSQITERFSTIKLHKPIPTIKLRASSIMAKIEAVKLLEGYQISTHDNDKDLTPLLKLLAEKDLSMYSWMQIDTYIPVEKITDYDEYIGNVDTLSPVLEEIPPPEFSELSIDLETDSSNHNKIPEAAGSLQNAIRVACITFSHGEKYEEYILTLGPDVSEYSSQDITNATRLSILPRGISEMKSHVFTFDNEILLIAKVFQIIRDVDPDVIEGHNHLGFDIPYLLGRWQLLIMHSSNKTQYRSIKIPNISRLKSYTCSQKDIEWHNSQVAIKGSCIDAPGRIWLDTLIVCSRSLFGQLPDSKLDTLAKERLGMSKDPVTAQDMFKVFKLFRDWNFTKQPDCPMSSIDIEKNIKVTYTLLYKKHNKRLPSLCDNPTLDQINSIIMMINTMSQRGEKLKLLNPNDMKKQDIQQKYLSLREKASILIDVWNVPTTLIDVDEILKILWWIVIKYCLQDTRIPTQAINQQGIISVLREQASIFSVSINSIMMRGQVFTSTAAQYRYNYKMNCMMDFGPKGGPVEPYEYEGGFVGKGKAGNKINKEGELVIILDFASLYPTAIVAYNICYTTWIPEFMRNTHLSSGRENPDYLWKRYEKIIPQRLEHFKHVLERQNTLPVEQRDKELMKEVSLSVSELQAILDAPYEQKASLMCNIFEVPNSHSKTINKHWFLKKCVKEGVVPKMLWDKFLDRRRVKKKMEQSKKEGNTAMYVTYNAQQLAIKVVMNATYGAFGTKQNRLANFPAAETITYIGRTSILKCNKFIEDEQIGQVVYNDTDSAMILIDIIKSGLGFNPAKVIEYPDQVATRINSQFPKPMSMEADGIFIAFFLYGPKMYAGIKWDKNSFNIADYTYEYVMSNVLLYVKGLQLVKRDRFKFQKDLFRDILFGVLTRESASNLIAKLESAIEDIWALKDGFKNAKLVEQDFSYNIGITPKSTEGGSGVMAKWKDIYEKKTGIKPSAGERFQLLVVVGQDKDKHTKSADKLMPINWILEDKKQLDVLHYILSLGKNGGAVDILSIVYPEQVPRKCIEKWYIMNLQKTNTLHGE